MFDFKEDVFLSGYQKRFGPLKTDLAEAIRFLLGKIEYDGRFTRNPVDRYQVAYCLATFKWETAHTLHPIDEFGAEGYFEKKYSYTNRVGKGLGNDRPGDGAKFHGRGYVQLTGRANYAKAAQYLKIDCLNHPELVKEPEYAYEIAVEGMKQGAFTGKRLDQYFRAGMPPDYEGARAIINGTDKAQIIADIARRFDELLVVSLKSVS